MTTNVSTFFADLDAGVFEEKLSRVLSEVAGLLTERIGDDAKVLIGSFTPGT